MFLACIPWDGPYLLVLHSVSQLLGVVAQMLTDASQTQRLTVVHLLGVCLLRAHRVTEAHGSPGHVRCAGVELRFHWASPTVDPSNAQWGGEWRELVNKHAAAASSRFCGNSLE